MIDKYIGVPFVDKESDCYAIIRTIYQEQKQITLPEFRSSCDDTRRIWGDYIKQISEHWELVDEPEEYDVLAFAYDPNHPKIVQHFGLYIGNGLMLHTLQNIGSHVAKLSDYSYCLKGIYRWKQ